MNTPTLRYTNKDFFYFETKNSNWYTKANRASNQIKQHLRAPFYYTMFVDGPLEQLWWRLHCFTNWWNCVPITGKVRSTTPSEHLSRLCESGSVPPWSCIVDNTPEHSRKWLSTEKRQSKRLQATSTSASQSFCGESPLVNQKMRGTYFSTTPDAWGTAEVKPATSTSVVCMRALEWRHVVWLAATRTSTRLDMVTSLLGRYRRMFYTAVTEKTKTSLKTSMSFFKHTINRILSYICTMEILVSGAGTFTAKIEHRVVRTHLTW